MTPEEIARRIAQIIKQQGIEIPEEINTQIARDRIIFQRHHRNQRRDADPKVASLSTFEEDAIASLAIFEQSQIASLSVFVDNSKLFGDLVLYTRIQKAVWQGNGACPVNPPPPPPGPPAPPPPPPPPPLRPPYYYCEKGWFKALKDGALISRAEYINSIPTFWSAGYTSYGVRRGIEGYILSRYISKQKGESSATLKLWLTEYNIAIGRGDSATANVFRNLLNGACDLTTHSGSQRWYPQGVSNVPWYLISEGYATSPPPPPGNGFELTYENCYEVRDTYVPSTETGSSTDDPGDEPNGDIYTRIISISGPHLPIELLRMRMSEAFSVEWSIANDSPDDAEWYFKIHYGTKSTGGWCSTRYIYLKNFQILQSADYLPPGPLLPPSQEVPIIEFKDLNSTSLLPISTLNYRLRTMSQKLNVKYQKPNGRQVVEETCIYTTNIPIAENDYEVRRHIGVWIPSRLRPRF